MQFQEVIHRRKMVRSFSKKPIEKEKLDVIVKNMLSSPSAGYSQGIELVILENQESREQFYEQWGDKEMRKPYRDKWPELENAPVIILVCVDDNRYHERYSEPDKSGLDNSPPWWYVDAGMTTLLGLLTAVDKELVACFTGVKSQRYLKKNFGIPKNIEIIGAISLGYSTGNYRPSKSALKTKREISEIVHNNYW